MDLLNMQKKFDLIEDALSDLKQGKIVIVCDDEKRENEGDFVVLAEFATPEIINFMITHARGLVCMPISEQYAKQLHLNPMVDKNTDNFKTAFTVSVDHITNSTGISASDRSTTITKLIADGAKIEEFRRPGHIFPLIAKPLGVLERTGHTEAVVDLAILCKAKPAGVLCEIVNADGTMARYDDLVLVSKKFNLKMIAISDLVQYRKVHDKLVKREVEADLPTQIGKFKIFGYSNILEDKEHVAITKGDFGGYCTNIEIKAKNNGINTINAPLVRLHSECLTGDVFHSLRCDCGEQLDNALTKIEEEGTGIVIYMRQEGRGIGLLNKLKAYQLQQTGLDTVEANHQLGFATDLREYLIAAQILHDLGATRIRLITNNPHKIKELESYGIKVLEVVSQKSTKYPENADYLMTKVKKLGHLI